MISLDTIALVVIPTSIVITIFFMYMYYREWFKETLINSTVTANCGVMRCSKCSHMSEYAALSALLFLALYSPQRIIQSLLKSQRNK